VYSAWHAQSAITRDTLFSLVSWGPPLLDCKTWTSLYIEWRVSI